MALWTDTILVEKARGGEPQAFAELYLRHKDWVYRYCLSRVGNGEVATDLVQDIFLRALEGLPRLQPGYSFGAWLNGITRHAVIDLLRRDQRRNQTLLQLGSEMNPSPDLEDPTSFEEIIYSDELIHQILVALGPEQRTLITLRLVEGRATSEVAALLHGENNEENRRKVTVGLYRAMQQARAVAEKRKKVGGLTRKNETAGGKATRE